MSAFQLFRLQRGQTEFENLEIECEDFQGVRDAFKRRGRRTDEQLLVLLDGLIYAVERSDGNGFAMIAQDRQNSEDDYWYPDKARA